MVRNIKSIKNKDRRAAIVAREKKEKAQAKRKRREKRKREVEALGADAPPAKVPHTLDSMREADETMVVEGDEEVMDDINFDQFSAHFRGESKSKLLFTTGRNPSKFLYPVVKDIMRVFPRTKYIKRRQHNVKDIVKEAAAAKFTNLIIVMEHNNKPCGMYVIHLPRGPTAYFKLSNFKATKSIPGVGQMSNHKPELILNNFSTRLGLTVGRMLGSLLPTDPEFHGRRVVTFHNQRDFIFFRHHRYIFENDKKVRMQELGPRFTLKLRWLQDGTFDTKHGEFEWVWKKEAHNRRRKFVL